MVLASELCYIGGSACLKIALGVLLLRVLVEKWQTYIIYATLCITTSYSTCYFFIVLFQCGAPSDFVIHWLGDSCLTPSVILGTSYTHAVVNAVADWTFAILPVFFLIRTDLDVRSKISVGAILALGSVYDNLVMLKLLRFLY